MRYSDRVEIPTASASAGLRTPALPARRRRMISAGARADSLRTYGIDPSNLVPTSEIAKLAGVKTTTVQAWTERHPSFPAPVRTFGTTRVWRWGDVAEWLAIPRPAGRPRKG